MYYVQWVQLLRSMCVVKTIQPCIDRIEDSVNDKVNDKVNKPSSAGNSHNINKNAGLQKISSNREHREDYTK
jgi:hypothetical protein